MLDAGEILEALCRRGVTFFTGVPDSLLKDLCAAIVERVPQSRHVIAANEGGAIAFAAGHHLATGDLAAVYLQNSGLGNAVNPLLSLADPDVYGLPMILVIGWRGEPDVRDEPQHRKQGRVTLALLEAMEMPHRILSSSPDEADRDIEWAAGAARQGSRPVALVVRKGTFARFTRPATAAEPVRITRERAVDEILGALDPSDAIVSTTGMISRQLDDARVRRGEAARDFLVVGSMGHASAIACAIAAARPERQVVCLDGDGALIMHMGTLAVQGALAVPNLKHIVLNNACHDSVGGQPTAALHADLTAVALACGYSTHAAVTAQEDIGPAVRAIREWEGPALLEIRMQRSADREPGRPATSPRENRDAFARFLRSG